MDERRTKIRDLETKKLSAVKARNRLLEALGESLFGRIGESEPFDSDAANTPGGVLAEYRKLQKDIDESLDLIKSLEKDVLRLKELEEAVSVREEEKSRLEKELEEAYDEIGKALFEDPEYKEAVGELRRQEEDLLARIDEQEIKLEELEKRQGGVFAWLGKNAQMTVAKTILSKNRSALRRFYRNAGEKYLSAKPADSFVEDNAETAGRALELKEHLSSLTAELSGLRGERRDIGNQFVAEGSPARRIQGLEKHIVHVKEKFPALYLRMGSLAAEGRETLSSFLLSEDEPVLEEAGLFKSQIAQDELETEKIRTAIKIDDEKAEIEKMKKAIKAQEQKISTAREIISGIEKHIIETEQHIEELRTFLNSNTGA